MKFCKDCAHMYGRGTFAECRRPSLAFTDLVSGDLSWHRVYVEWDRGDSSGCGKDGKHFEPKPPRVSFWQRLFDGVKAP